MTLTKENLLEYFRDKMRVDVSEIEDETPLFSSGLIDSFAIVELLLFLEKHTGSRLGAEDINLDNLDTVQQILSFAASRASA